MERSNRLKLQETTWNKSKRLGNPIKTCALRNMCVCARSVLVKQKRSMEEEKWDGKKRGKRADGPTALIRLD